MGLLNYVTATSLDEDYAHASQQRRQRGEGGVRRPGRVGVVMFALFGLLVATAGVQTARTASVAETGHEALVRQVHAAQDRLQAARASRARMERSLSAATEERRSAAAALTAVEERVVRLGIWGGSEAVTGPGVRIRVDDAPNATSDEQTVLDKDLQNIVNGLWQAGAEAIAVNGQRITPLTAIRVAGSAITVNYERLAPPYTILAIGDQRRLPSLFVESTTGSFWLNAQRRFNLAFEITSEESLTVPAASPRRTRLHNAGPPEERQ